MPNPGEFEDILENGVLGSSSPLRGRFLLDSTEAVYVKRTFSGLTKTGTGTGNIQPYGDHTNVVDTDYRIEIDGAGDHDSATFKWSNDGGSTWIGELLPLSYLHRYMLDNGMEVLFSRGVYDAGDYWDWTAIATGDQVYSFIVDTTNNKVQVGNILEIYDDEFQIYVDGGATGAAVIIFGGGIGSVTGAIEYNRSFEQFLFFVDGSTELKLTGTGLELTQAARHFKLNSGTLLFDNYSSMGSVSPSTDEAHFYAKSDGLPYWANSSQEWGFALKEGADLILDGGAIRPDTADASDTSFTQLLGGGASGSTRGAGIGVFGNENSAFGGILAGAVFIDAGNVATGHIYLRTGSGTTRVELTDDAKIGFFAVTPVVQQTSGANLTNNVTSGGSNDVIANFTDLSTYSNDAATIRNDIYQLARKLKQVNDALRSYGLLT
jgi:hypothetical protein